MSHRHSEAIFPNCCCCLPHRDAWADKDWSPGVSQTTNSQSLRVTVFSKTGKARKLQLQTSPAPTLQSCPFSFDTNGPRALLFSEATFLPGRICGFLQCSVAQGHAGRHVAVAPFALGCRSAAAGQGKSPRFCDSGESFPPYDILCGGHLPAALCLQDPGFHCKNFPSSLVILLRRSHAKPQHTPFPHLGQNPRFVLPALSRNLGSGVTQAGQ